MTTEEQIERLLAPYLAQVKALADSRPELNAGNLHFRAHLHNTRGISFAALLFYNGIADLVMSDDRETPEAAIDQLKTRLAEIPAPPSREELIAKKRAELAELEGVSL